MNRKLTDCVNELTYHYVQKHILSDKLKGQFNFSGAIMLLVADAIRMVMY